MTPRTWLGRLFTREAVPRRNRPQTTLILDALPDRDSPSSIDPSEFALVIGAGIAGRLGTTLRIDPRPTTDRVDVWRWEPVPVEVRWDPPIVIRSQPSDAVRFFGLSEPPDPAGVPPSGGLRHLIRPPEGGTPAEPRPPSADPVFFFPARPVPATGVPPAIAADRPAEPALPAVVRLAPAKPPAAKPAPPEVKPPFAPPPEVADPPAAEAGEELGVFLAGRIVWVDPPPAMHAPAADPVILLEHAPPEVPPTVLPASPPPAASPEPRPGKVPYDPTPVLLPTADSVAFGLAASDPAYHPPTEPPAIRPASPRVVVVSPIPAAGGQPVAPGTPVFHITAAVDAGGPLVVPYTLAAHDATGTATATGAVTLTAGAGPVVITAGSALARRSADLLTLTARQRAGATRWASATVFLTPAHRAADAALFEAHRLARSPEAFRALVRRHGPAVTQACQRMVGNRADAEDVSQFVLLELARWRSQFSGTLAAWLRAVARNASLAFLRAKRRRQRHEHEAARPVAADAAAIAVLDETLAAAVAQLPVALGEAVRLRYLEGYSQQEAAAIAGCPRGTLSRRAAEGIQLLRERLASEPTG